MNPTIRRLSLLMLAAQSLVLSSVASCSSEFQGQAYSALAPEIAEVKNMIDNYIQTDRLQGAALLLVKDNQIIYSGAFGEYSENTVVPIASASKWLSAAVVMTLVDDRTIALDDRVGQYLPNFTGEKGSITIRQLLSHTSGLPTKHRCLSDRFITLAECVNQISQTPLLAYPGTEFNYGGVSFQVAGRVAEVASGKSWNTLFEERIKNPLSMVDTSYYATLNPNIGAGAVSTIGDYRNFLEMILNGGVFNGSQVLSGALITEMERNHTDGVEIVFSPRLAADKEGYGLGLWRDIVDNNGRLIQVSSPGAFGFTPWIDRQRNLVGVFLVKDRFPNIYQLVHNIQKILRDAIDSELATSNS
ncbi:MAG: serine hydrolase domain-containing protein [Hormoscilla sp.]